MVYDVPCPDCIDGHSANGFKDCETCGGSGWVESIDGKPNIPTPSPSETKEEK